MVTIKEIAELADVSIGTVDRVIHNRGTSSKKTEAKVKKVLKQVNYKPNIIARSLVSKKTVTFGIFMPEPHQDEKFWELPEQGIKKAEKELKIYKVKVIHFYYDKNSNTAFKKCFNKILKKKNELDGLVIAPVMPKLSEEYIEKIPAELPYVFIDSYIPNSKCISYIGQNVFQSGIVSARLMQLAVKKSGTIAVIKLVPKFYNIEERTKGFMSFFKKDKNIKVKIYNAELGKGDIAFYEQTRLILDENSDLRGIFIPNAFVGCVAKYIDVQKIKRKICVIGYDLTETNKTYLNKGTIDFLLSQKSEVQGYQGIMNLFKYVVLKEKVDKELITPIDVLFKENLDNYKDHI